MTVPDGKAQAIYKSPRVQGLGVRVTAKGTKTFVYDRSVKGKTVRINIGPAPRSVNDDNALSVPEAEAIAFDLNVQVAAGRDPRAIRLEKGLADSAALDREKQQRDRESVTLRNVWNVYIEERSPNWSERHHRDAVNLADPGGRPHKRGSGKTKPGPLASLMKEPLVSIDQDRITAWAKMEGAKRPTQARLARRHLIACMRWCLEEGPREWRHLVDREALKLTRTASRRLGKPKAKDDRLEAPQLKAFFSELKKHSVPVTRAFITTLLLTGARKNEISKLEWPHVDWRWKRLTLHDKATQDKRVIPLTPYVESVLRDIERNKPADVSWVFASHRKPGEALQWVNKALAEVCKAAGIERISVHGLRRSFASLAESADLPAGAVAQIMGHAPTAIAEKHYRRRSIDELRAFAVRFESWMLESAEIEFTPETEGLRLVKG